MNIMTKMETIVMNMTGCNRETANLVVNAIIDEWDGENEIKSTKYRIYNVADGKKIKTTEVYENKFDASQRCFWLNENAIGAIYGQYVYEAEDE